MACHVMGRSSIAITLDDVFNLRRTVQTLFAYVFWVNKLRMNTRPQIN